MCFKEKTSCRVNYMKIVYIICLLSVTSLMYFFLSRNETDTYLSPNHVEVAKVYEEIGWFIFVFIYEYSHDNLHIDILKK